MPMAVMICRNCGFASFHSLGALGLSAVPVSWSFNTTEAAINQTVTFPTSTGATAAGNVRGREAAIQTLRKEPGSACITLFSIEPGRFTSISAATRHCYSEPWIVGPLVAEKPCSLIHPDFPQPTHYDLSSGIGYNLPEDSKPVKHLQTNVKGEKKVLDLGSNISGEKYECKEGKTISCDSDYMTYPGVTADYRCDLRKLPFNNDEFDIVYSSCLEAFSEYEHVDLLKEWLRVVKPKGEFRLVVDNAEFKHGSSLFVHLLQFKTGHTKRFLFSKESIHDTLVNVGITPENIEFVPSTDDKLGIRIIK